MQPTFPNELATLFAAAPGGKAGSEDGSATAFAAFLTDQTGSTDNPLAWQVLSAAVGIDAEVDPEGEVVEDTATEIVAEDQIAAVDAALAAPNATDDLAKLDESPGAMPSDPVTLAVAEPISTVRAPVDTPVTARSAGDLSVAAQGIVLPRRGPVSELVQRAADATVPAETATAPDGRRAEGAISATAAPNASGLDKAQRISAAGQAAREALVEFASARRTARDRAAETAVDSSRPSSASPAPSMSAQVVQASLQPLSHVIAAGLGPDPRDAARFGRDRDAVSELITVTASEGRAAPVASAGAPTLAPAPQQPIPQQLALAISRSAGGETEITLHPEELGRVRLSVSGSEGAMTLSISADRPETNDLIRRHLDQLAAEFRDMGYANLSFSFGTASQQGRSEARASAADRAEPGEWVDLEPTSRPEPAPPSASAGLDLRL